MEPREKYEDSKKNYRDIKNCMDTAFNEGKEAEKEEGLKQGEIKGLKKGRIEGQKAMIIDIIRKGVNKNISIETLTHLTGLTEKEVIDIISTLRNDVK
jgi:flagellar biosynthesis/type III secretory pathway protein FliH